VGAARDEISAKRRLLNMRKFFNYLGSKLEMDDDCNLLAGRAGRVEKTRFRHIH
jgi:hypothetical protein